MVHAIKSYGRSLGTIQGNSKSSKASSKVGKGVFGRPDIGPGSKMQGKKHPRPSRGIGY